MTTPLSLFKSSAYFQARARLESKTAFREVKYHVFHLCKEEPMYQCHKNGVRFTKLTIGIVVEILLLIHYMTLNGQSRVKIMLF